MADLPPTYHQFNTKENEPLQSDLQRPFLFYEILNFMFMDELSLFLLKHPR